MTETCKSAGLDPEAVRNDVMAYNELKVPGYDGPLAEIQCGRQSPAARRHMA
jgi:hypothetical protein